MATTPGDGAAQAGRSPASAAIRTVALFENYGLYGGRPWAEVIAAVSGAVYVPYELVELVRHPTWHGALLLAVNLLVVALMVRALLRRRMASSALAP